jgi:hypothetical protein
MTALLILIVGLAAGILVSMALLSRAALPHCHGYMPRSPMSRAEQCCGDCAVFTSCHLETLRRYP